ncbi:MAG TPA: hypothetical protein VHE81_03520, partial [Lacipirellulaceae bacterium]|nr:hypothetical protein [Lacipirellulaceae bacterium]
SPSLDTRREWIESLQREQKAELVDRARAFAELDPASDDQQHMRQVMENIRTADDRAKLQETLVAYGQWISRRTPGQQEELRQQLQGATVEKQVEIIHRRIDSEERLALRHLSDDDAERLRQEISRLVNDNRSDWIERARQNKPLHMNFERPFDQQRMTMMVLVELMRGSKREATVKQLVGALSPVQQEHWQSLEHDKHELAKRGQLWIWIQDAMKLKADPEKLENFFTKSGNLSSDQRQKLLDEPRDRMQKDLERMYYRSELGIENPGQLFGDFGEPGRWNGRGVGPPPGDAGGRNRRPGFIRRREPPPDGEPSDRRPDFRRRPAPDQPPPAQVDKKPDAV